MTSLDSIVASQPILPFDIESIRADFPILKLKVDGHPLVFLDSAASSQMPQQVIDRLVRYQTTQHANIHRAVHYLSELATAEFEQARHKLQHFINAREDREVIFTSGTTESINLVMHGYGRKFIGPGDEIILTVLEHHYFVDLPCLNTIIQHLYGGTQKILYPSQRIFITFNQQSFVHPVYQG